LNDRLHAIYRKSVTVTDEGAVVLHPEIVKTLADQRQSELRATATQCRRGPAHRILPRWRVSWSRAKLTAATERGSALIIVISSSRSAARGASRLA
jgi:hypothetical protein